MEIAVIVVIVSVAAFLYMTYESVKRKAERQQAAAAMIEIEAYQQAVEAINQAKTTATKLKRCDAALDLLEAADPNLINVEASRAQIESMKAVLPIVDHLRKADRNRFKGKEGPERNNLQDALYEMRENEVTDEDFERAEVIDDKTGRVVTIASIEGRLRELGWERE